MTPALRLRERTAALVEPAGYRTGDPLLVGVRMGDTPAAYLTSGRTAAGESLTVDTVALDDDEARTVSLANALIEELTT